MKCKPHGWSLVWGKTQLSRLKSILGTCDYETTSENYNQCREQDDGLVRKEDDTQADAQRRRVTFAAVFEVAPQM